jgi:hypothetical protein
VAYLITSFLLYHWGRFVWYLSHLDWPHWETLGTLFVLWMEYRWRGFPRALILPWYARYRKFDDKVSRCRWLACFRAWDFLMEAQRLTVLSPWVWNNEVCICAVARYHAARGTPHYRYGQVEDFQIRLLEIEQRIPFGPIRCNIRYVALSDAPPYETVCEFLNTLFLTRAITNS